MNIGDDDDIDEIIDALDGLGLVSSNRALPTARPTNIGMNARSSDEHRGGKSMPDWLECMFAESV